MGLGLEIYFLFDKEEPIEKIQLLTNYCDFDMRNGLNLIMTGVDCWEILNDEETLLKRIEKELEINLSILDFWSNQDEFNIHTLIEILTNLKWKLNDNPMFYKKIDYGFDIAEQYLKSKFLNDIDFLLERLTLNVENGATKVKYSTDYERCIV